jgi:hypothetical protein
MVLLLLLLLFSPFFFPIVDIFLTWCCSFHVMKSFLKIYLIIKTGFN